MAHDGQDEVLGRSRHPRAVREPFGVAPARRLRTATARRPGNDRSLAEIAVQRPNVDRSRPFADHRTTHTGQQRPHVGTAVVMPSTFDRAVVRQCCDPFVCLYVSPMSLALQRCILGLWLLLNTNRKPRAGSRTRW